MKEYVLVFDAHRPDELKKYLKRHHIKYGSWFESILNKPVMTCSGILVEAIRIDSDNEVSAWARKEWYEECTNYPIKYIKTDSREFLGEI